MTKGKYTYQSYDYSFLKPKDSDPWYLPNAIRVAARTIGFDMTPVEPMNEPVGQLFYFEPTITATTTDGGGQITATTYEPLHTGGWEVTLTPPTPIVEEATIATTATASTHESNSSDNSTENMLNEWIRLHYEWKNRRKEIVNNNRSVSYWKKCNFFKNLRNKKYVKKV